MNLVKMFETQKVLDEKIYTRFPGLKEEDWSWKITALLSELGECVNEHRGFKRWSEDKEPRVLCPDCKGTGHCHHSGFANPMEPCGECNGYPFTKNPLLEEFVDCIHFFISIAIELKMFPNALQVYENHTEPTVERSFNKVSYEVASIDVLRNRDISKRVVQEDLQETLYIAFSCFIGIGEQFLGFTWKQIEEAYYAKNKINHTRQENGY